MKRIYEIENKDIAHKTKYIKIFYLKHIINTIIDYIFPNELLFKIINDMHYNKSISHKIDIIENIEYIKISFLQKEEVIERLKYQFGENKIKVIKEKGYEEYRIEIIGFTVNKNEKLIITKYKPNNKIVFQGKLSGNKNIKNIVNLCLIND